MLSVFTLYLFINPTSSLTLRPHPSLHLWILPNDSHFDDRPNYTWLELHLWAFLFSTSTIITPHKSRAGGRCEFSATRAIWTESRWLLARPPEDTDITWAVKASIEMLRECPEDKNNYTTASCQPLLAARCQTNLCRAVFNVQWRGLYIKWFIWCLVL